MNKNLMDKINLQVDLNCDVIALLEMAEKLYIEQDYDGIFLILKDLQKTAVKANELWKEEMNECEDENSKSINTITGGRDSCDFGRARKTNNVHHSETNFRGQETFGLFNDSTENNRNEEVISNAESK